MITGTSPFLMSPKEEEEKKGGTGGDMFLGNMGSFLRNQSLSVLRMLIVWTGFDPSGRM